MLRKHNIWYTITDGNWSNPNTWISNGKRKNSLPQPGDDVYIDNNIVFDTAATTNNLYVAGSLTAGTNSITLTINGDLQATGPLNFAGSNITIILNGYNNNVNSFTAGNTTVKYNRAGDQNVLPVTYKNLLIYNTGIKYLSANTIIQGNLNVNDFQPQDAFLECGNYDLTVNGNTSITAKGNNGNGNFSKSGSGNIVFKGNLNINANSIFSSAITSLECQGGFTGGGFGGNILINCPFKFTTSSQTFNTSSIYFNSAVLISGVITVTCTNSGGVYFMNGLNGDNASSTLNNNGLINMGFTSPAMSTGIFNYMNGPSSSMAYVMNTDFTLPYPSYNNLIVLGTGLKSLCGNTSVANLNINNFYGDRARLDCLTYDLTINGNATIAGTGTGNNLDAGLMKSGAGNIIFLGSASYNTANIAYPSNVNLEFRNGVNFGAYGVHTGSVDAVINFTTNSQTLTGNSQIINGPINISSGITLSIGGNGLIINGVINGSTNADTLKLTGVIYYNNPSAPMSIGSVDASSILNTFIYSNTSANQDLKAGTYQNLSLGSNTFGGGGSKRLLGNISVLGNYNLVSPTILNANGFTLANP